MSDFLKALPEWNDPGIEPPQTVKDAGWKIKQRPPASYFDWFQYTTFQALQELQNFALHIDEKGAIDGVASLDGTGKVPDAQLKDASTSAKGIVQLNSATNSTSETTAATPKAVKDAYDLALAAETTSGAQTKATAAENNAKAYTDSKVAHVTGTYTGTGSQITISTGFQPRAIFVYAANKTSYNGNQYHGMAIDVGDFYPTNVTVEDALRIVSNAAYAANYGNVLLSENGTIYNYIAFK